MRRLRTGRAANFIEPSSKAIVYSSNVLNKLAGTLVIIIGLWLLWSLFLPVKGLTSGTSWGGYSLTWKILLTGLVVLCGLGCFFTVRTTIVDPVNKLVIWRRGIWPVVVARSQPFSAFAFVRVMTVWHSGRYSYYPSYRALLCLSQGGQVYLFDVRDPIYAFESANGVALTMGIPLDNEEQAPIMTNLFGF